MSDMPKAVFLKDYQPPHFLIKTIDLHIELGDETVVKARSRFVRNGQHVEPLVLDGQHLRLREIKCDGARIPEGHYGLTKEHLVLNEVPDDFILEIETVLRPSENAALEGLYQSGSMYCTQCEAEGFRRITYFIDRPDVMAVFTTTVVADQARYPILLSNGNCVATGVTHNNKHWATWQDPFPKPCYLFALVAGDLEWITDRFTTQSGRQVELKIFVDKGNQDKCNHAMQSLKNSMRWDEEIYGREYDLDIYMVVAVNDFNMGAMENKGLNIFNAKYVLAKPETATDVDYAGIESVIGHEYFHNWSGNRVTCRDWFQLSLKEGFTVFRDQEFSCDMGSRAVKRIDEVNYLRTYQFPEDAGPLAHPVRPESYVEINNFYTVTIYNKGAEVIRMMHCLLGAKPFRAGTDLYFARHDGQAVTTEDFVKAMEDASGYPLDQFRLWYQQAGTPTVTVERQYEAKSKTFYLTLSQHCEASPGQATKKPFHIPIACALLGADGKLMPARLQQGNKGETGEWVLELREATQTFVFEEVSETPVPSLLRGFSAPIKLDAGYTANELAFLLQHDSDPFSRWEAGQQLALQVILQVIKQGIEQAGGLLAILQHAYEGILNEVQPADMALNARLLTLPAEANIAEAWGQDVDPLKIRRARQGVMHKLGVALRDAWLRVYRQHPLQSRYLIDPKSVAARALRNSCLPYLLVTQETAMLSLCASQFYHANNMTDGLAALEALVEADGPERDDALNHFYDRWQHEPLVVDKWLAIQAGATRLDTLEQVKHLLQHPAFAIKNPNKVRALVGTFSRNLGSFHVASGEGYALLADVVLQLNKFNPQIAARILTPLTQWRRYVVPLREKMRESLERIAGEPDLEKDVHEVVSKSLSI